MFYRTVLLLLKMVVEYCQCVDDIPSVAPDLLTRLVDLLKVSHYNYLANFPEGNCSKICLKWLLSKRPQIGVQDQSLLTAGQK